MRVFRVALGAISLVLSAEITVDETLICPWLNGTTRSKQIPQSKYSMKCSEVGAVELQLDKDGKDWYSPSKITLLRNVSFAVGSDAGPRGWIELQKVEDPSFDKYTIDIRNVYAEIRTQHVLAGIAYAPWIYDHPIELVLQLNASKVAVEFQIPKSFSLDTIAEWRLNVTEAVISGLDFIVSARNMTTRGHGRTVENGTNHERTVENITTKRRRGRALQGSSVARTPCVNDEDCRSLACGLGPNSTTVCCTSEDEFTPSSWSFLSWSYTTPYCHGLALPFDACVDSKQCQQGWSCLKDICGNCEADFHATEKYDECLACPANSVADADATPGTPTNCACKEDFHTNLTSNECIPCPANSSVVAGSIPGTQTNCTCKADFHTSLTSDECIACPANSSVVAGSIPGTLTSCTCKADFHTRLSSNECIACPANSGGVAGSIPGTLTSCTCKKDFYSTTKIADGCIPCPTGISLEEGSTPGIPRACDTCKRNFYSTTNVTDGCIPCPKGKLLEGGSTPGIPRACDTCNADFYATANDCLPCAKGSNAAAGSKIGTPSNCTYEIVTMFREAWAVAFKEKVGSHWRNFTQEKLTGLMEKLQTWLLESESVEAFAPPTNSTVAIDGGATPVSTTYYPTGTKCSVLESRDDATLSEMDMETFTNTSLHRCALFDRPLTTNPEVVSLAVTETEVFVATFASELLPHVYNQSAQKVARWLNDAFKNEWTYANGVLSFSSFTVPAPDIVRGIFGDIHVQGTITGIENFRLRPSMEYIRLQLNEPATIALNVSVGAYSFPFAFDLTELELDVKPYIFMKADSDICWKHAIDTVDASFVDAKLAIKSAHIPADPSYGSMIESLNTLIELPLLANIVLKLLRARIFEPRLSGRTWTPSVISHRLRMFVERNNRRACSEFDPNPQVPQASDWDKRVRWAQWKGTKLASSLVSNVMTRTTHAHMVRRFFLESAYHNKRVLVVPMDQRDQDRFVIYSPKKGAYTIRAAAVVPASKSDLTALAHLMDPFWTVFLNSTPLLPTLPRNVSLELLQIHQHETNAWYAKGALGMTEILNRITGGDTLSLVFAHVWNISPDPKKVVTLNEITISISHPDVGRISGPRLTMREDIQLSTGENFTDAFALSVSRDVRRLFTRENIPFGPFSIEMIPTALVVRNARVHAMNGCYLQTADHVYTHGKFRLVHNKTHWILHGAQSSLVQDANYLVYDEAGHWDMDGGLTLHRTNSSPGAFAKVFFGQLVFPVSGRTTFVLQKVHNGMQLLLQGNETKTISCWSDCDHPTVEVTRARTAVRITHPASIVFDVINAVDAALGATVDLPALSVSASGQLTDPDSNVSSFEFQLAAEDLKLQVGVIFEMFTEYLNLDRDQRSDARCKAQHIDIHKLYSLLADVRLQSWQFVHGNQTNYRDLRSEISMKVIDDTRKCAEHCAGKYMPSLGNETYHGASNCIVNPISKHIFWQNQTLSVMDCGLRMVPVKGSLSKYFHGFFNRMIFSKISKILQKPAPIDDACPPRKSLGLHPEAETILTSLFVILIAIAIVCALIGSVGAWFRWWDPSTTHALPDYGSFGSSAVMPAGVGIAIGLAIIGSLCGFLSSIVSILGTLRVTFREMDPELGVVHLASFDRKEFAFLDSIDTMYESHTPELATALAACSGVLPLVNSALMLYTWFAPPCMLPRAWRARVVSFVDLTAKFILLNILFLTFFVTIIRVHLALNDDDLHPNVTVDAYIAPGTATFIFLMAGLASVVCAFILLSVHRLNEHIRLQRSLQEPSLTQICAYNTIRYLTADSDCKRAITVDATSRTRPFLSAEEASRKCAFVSFHALYAHEQRKNIDLASMSPIRRLGALLWVPYIRYEWYFLPFFTLCSCAGFFCAYFFETLGVTYGGLVGFLMHSEAATGTQSTYTAVVEEGKYVTATRLQSLATIGMKTAYTGVYDLDVEGINWKVVVMTGAFFFGTIVVPVLRLAISMQLWFIPSGITKWELLRASFAINMSTGMFAVACVAYLLELISIENVADHLAGYPLPLGSIVDQLFGHLFVNKVLTATPYFNGWFWFMLVQCIVIEFCMWRFSVVFSAGTTAVSMVVKDPVVAGDDRFFKDSEFDGKADSYSSDKIDSGQGRQLDV